MHRRFIDAIAVVTIVGLGAGFGYTQVLRFQNHRRINDVGAAVDSFERIIKIKAATDGTELTGRGWPVTIDPSWFEGLAPRNELLSRDRPWLEVATQGDASLMHPPTRVVLGESVASFWYNPYQGVVRARVPYFASDEETLRVYNRVNGCRLESLYAPEARAAAPGMHESEVDDPGSDVDDPMNAQFPKSE